MPKELKTLKDLEVGDKLKSASSQVLRDEAIKYILVYKHQLREAKIKNLTNEIERIRGALDFIRRFFNLSEETLK